MTVYSAVIPYSPNRHPIFIEPSSHIHPIVIPERNVAFREVKTRDLTATLRHSNKAHSTGHGSSEGTHNKPYSSSRHPGAERSFREVKTRDLTATLRHSNKAHSTGHGSSEETHNKPYSSNRHPGAERSFREVKTRDLTATKRRIAQVDARSRVFAIATLRDDEGVGANEGV